MASTGPEIMYIQFHQRETKKRKVSSKIDGLM